MTYNWTSSVVWSIVELLELLKAGKSTGIEKGFVGLWNWEVKPPNIDNSAGLEKGLLWVWASEMPLPNRFAVLDVIKFPTVH